VVDNVKVCFKFGFLRKCQKLKNILIIRIILEFPKNNLFNFLISNLIYNHNHNNNFEKYFMINKY